MLKIWIVVAMMGKNPVVAFTHNYNSEELCKEKASLIYNSEQPEAKLLNLVGVEYVCTELIDIEQLRKDGIK